MNEKAAMTDLTGKLTPELKDKIHRILGIPVNEVDQWDSVDLIAELCDTVFMLDGQEVLFKINTLKGRIQSVETRMRNLMGLKETKRSRDANPIAELERYVGELKRHTAELEAAHEEDERLLKDSIQLYERQEAMITELTARIEHLEEELRKARGD